jgi:SWI/SNF-related matrix-associated actin-dependent regulator of chromatin subfamily B protein 1
MRAPPSLSLPGETCKIQYQPRIRCNDCTGKWYNVRRGKVVEDFEVHLRNRGHMENVKARLAATAANPAGGNARAV